MLHTLSRSLRENKGPALVTVLLSALEVVFEIVIPLFMSNLIDFGIEGGSMAAVWKFGAFLLLLAAFQLATGVLAARIAARASVGFGANLREDMYNNVQTFAFSNIDKFSTASIVTRLTTDVTNVQNAFQMLMRMAIRSPVMLVISMIVSFRISRDISMTFLVILPILAVALFFIIRSVFPIFTRVFRTYDELNNVVQENVRGIRVVKSFNQEQHEIRKFGAISERIYKDFSKGERLITLNAPLMQSCIYACMIIISWLGAKAIIASGNDPALGLTTGNLTALITYAMQILSSLMMLSMVFAMLTISLSSARRIAEVIEEKTDIQNPEHPIMAVRDGAIDFDHVSFVYASKADKKVLDDIEQKPDFIVLDPPRDGIHPKALEKIISYGVEKMVYISCKPTSLARDLEVLLARGYEAERICCVDMFPQTTGIETVCLLGKRKPDAKVKIGIDMDDYYRIRENAESK